MPDNNGQACLDLLTKSTNDIAREIGEMDPNDPLRAERVKELYALTELIKSPKAERNKLIYEKMDALAREIGALKPRDARRADIVNEIIRLSHLIAK
jgi:tRNA A37 N6-isopentenylltransferase MiaA